jgi:hypothetical protein
MPNLDWWARKNIGVITRQRPLAIVVDHNHKYPVTVQIAGEKLTHTSVEHLHTWTCGKRTLTYCRLCQEQHTEVAQQTHIQWDAASKAPYQTLPLGFHQWHAKYVSGHLPTSQVLLKRKYQDHAECPRCDIVPETQAHRKTGASVEIMKQNRFVACVTFCKIGPSACYVWHW